jgi:hypothetical protein
MNWPLILIVIFAALLAFVAAQHRTFLVGSVEGYYRPQSTDFQPSSEGDTVAQPAPVDAPLVTAPVVPTPNPVGHSQQIVPSDLLPRNVNKDWLKDQRVAALSMPSLAAPDFRTGRDTIGQSMKNPNLQIRPDPPIGRTEETGPFNRPVIEPDRSDKSELAIR